jgi:hypothetical protein
MKLPKELTLVRIERHSRQGVELEPAGLTQSCRGISDGRSTSRRYDRHTEKLREELTVARMDRHSGQLEELDVEGMLAFAERILPRAADLWVQASLEQRQRRFWSRLLALLLKTAILTVRVSPIREQEYNTTSSIPLHFPPEPLTFSEDSSILRARSVSLNRIMG